MSSRERFVVEDERSLRTPATHLLSMPKSAKHDEPASTWTPIPDTPERFSSGIPDFDRLLGGGFPRGSHALFEMDETIEPRDRSLLLTPLYLNFLYQSRGVLAVLPSRETPHGFRADLTRWVSRRRFDTRVRVVVYVSEDTEVPYVVDLSKSRLDDTVAAKKRSGKEQMAKMVVAEKAVMGVREKPFVEMVAFEIAEMLFGADVATRMFFHGVKRARIVGNLVLGLLRPGLGCADAARGNADVILGLHRGELGLVVRGVRPAFPGHLVVVDPRLGAPHVSFVPAT
ncbi:MAG: hypothetical protein L3J77_00395 [Thermoplasmata archaeon]|nr:hypothetical protein [Thermoplasmata archaeon]